MPRALVVEDKDAKFHELKEAVEKLGQAVNVERASNVVAAENALEMTRFDLLVLDISMDISGTSKGAFGGGHANLGGLDIVDTMYYEGIVIPTIVVTGLDYFISQEGADGAEYIGLDELDSVIRKRMPNGYLGYVRYGVEGWAGRLRALCEGLKW